MSLLLLFLGGDIPVGAETQALWNVDEAVGAEVQALSSQATRVAHNQNSENQYRQNSQRIGPSAGIW